MEIRSCIAVTFLLDSVSSSFQISVCNTTSPQPILKQHNPVIFPVTKVLNFHLGSDMNESIEYGIIQNKSANIEDPVVNRSGYVSVLLSLHSENVDELKLALAVELQKTHRTRRSVDYEDHVGQNQSREISVSVRKARKVESEITTPKENRHAALVMVFKSYEDVKKKEKDFCSGSMLKSTWVLTAARCVSKKLTFYIYTGGNDYFEYEDKRYPEGSDYDNGMVNNKVFVLPDYSGNDPIHDLALIDVGTGSLGLKTGTIELSTYLLPFDQYKSCSFTGFGRRDKRPFDTYRRRTHYMNVKSPCPCVGGTEEKDSALLCSEPGGGYEVCDGDLGAGLVCDGELVAVATKLISQSTCKDITIDKEHLCGPEDAIVVFVKICPYLAWINKDGRIFKDYYGTKTTCHAPTPKPKPVTHPVTDPIHDYDYVTDNIEEHSTSKVRRPKKNKTRKNHHPRNNSHINNAVRTLMYLCSIYTYLAQRICVRSFV